MSKFCTKCGKSLEEGKVCDCQTNTQKENTLISAAGVTTSSQSNVNQYVNTLMEMVKNIFTRPVTTIKTYATSNNLVVGLIAIIINALICGLFLYFFAKESVDSLSAFGLFGSTGSFDMLGSSSFTIEIPFIKTMLYGVIFMLAGFITTAAMIYVIAGPLFKDKVDFKKIISLIGVCSVFTSITTIIATICLFVSVKFAMIILLIAGVFYLTHLYQGIKETTSVDSNKLAYVFVPAISVATFVVTFLLPKILF